MGAIPIVSARVAAGVRGRAPHFTTGARRMQMVRLAAPVLAAVLALAAATALVEHDREAARNVSTLTEIGLDRAERPPPGTAAPGLARNPILSEPADSPFLGHASGGPFSIPLLRSLRFSLVEPARDTPRERGRSTPGGAWREARLVRATRDDRARIEAYARRYRIPDALSTQIYEAALAERVSPALAYSLIRVESGFDPRAVGIRGSIGLTQIRPSTARELAPSVTATDLYVPRVNLALGLRYLRRLLVRFDHDVAVALAAYNRGPTRVEAQLERGDLPRIAYVTRILRDVERGSRRAL